MSISNLRFMFLVFLIITITASIAKPRRSDAETESRVQKVLDRIHERYGCGKKSIHGRLGSKGRKSAQKGAIKGVGGYGLASLGNIGNLGRLGTLGTLGSLGGLSDLESYGNLGSLGTLKGLAELGFGGFKGFGDKSEPELNLGPKHKPGDWIIAKGKDHMFQ